MRPDTIVIVVTAATPYLTSATYLPLKSAGTTLTGVKQWMLNRLEGRHTLPVLDPDTGEQLFLIQDNLLMARVTTIERLEAELAEEERMNQAAEHANKEEARAPDPDDLREDLLDEAREVQADLEEERLAAEEELEDEEYAPSWGVPEDEGPPAG